MSKISNAARSIGQSAAIKASQPIKSAMQEIATTSGWPEHIVNQLDVVHKDGQLFVSYPPSISKEIMDLEYGTEEIPPRSVIRRLDYMLPEMLQPYIEKEFDARMSEFIGAL